MGIRRRLASRRPCQSLQVGKINIFADEESTSKSLYASKRFTLPPPARGFRLLLPTSALLTGDVLVQLPLVVRVPHAGQGVVHCAGAKDDERDQASHYNRFLGAQLRKGRKESPLDIVPPRKLVPATFVGVSGGWVRPRARAAPVVVVASPVTVAKT